MSAPVAAIIPVHNGAPYLAAALESVLAQSLPPAEIIVVDDGSTDSSASVAARYGAAIRYHYQRNAGAGAARNRAVELSTAPYLAFLDQDDLWTPDRLALQLAAFAADPALDMVFGHVQQFISPDWPDPLGGDLYCPPVPVPGYLPSALLLRRAAFDRVGPFGVAWRLAAWADWYARAVDAGLKAKLLPQTVAYRRLHGQNSGLVSRDHNREYPRLLKAALDRRRAGGAA